MAAAIARGASKAEAVASGHAAVAAAVAERQGQMRRRITLPAPRRQAPSPWGARGAAAGVQGQAVRGSAVRACAVYVGRPEPADMYG